MLLHLRFFITIRFPQSAVKYFHSSIVHLSPTMEPATLTQGADCVGERMVQVVEEHLVPAVFPTEDESHGTVQPWPRALWIVRKEFVPWMGMREVGDEHPCCTKSTTSKERHREHKAISFAQRPTERIRSNKPDARPKAPHKTAVSDSPRQPFLEELFVALSTSSFIWEVHIPLDSEQRSCVVEAEEVD